MSTERVKYPESLENLLSVMLLSSFDSWTLSFNQIISGGGTPVAMQANTMLSLVVVVLSSG